MKGKQLLAAALAGCMLLGVTGCGAGSIEELGSKVGNEIRAAGRDHSKDYTAKDNEVLTNTFFSYQINSAEMVSTLNDYIPNDADKAFLVIDITIKNVFEDDSSIPMTCYDFELSWPGQTEGETISPDVGYELSDELSDEWSLPKGGSTTGKLIFIVPSEATEFSLIYKELYEDDFEGSTYSIAFTPDRSNYVPLEDNTAA